MNIRIVLIGLLSFALGIGAHAFYSRLSGVPQTTADHWRIVNRYRQHLFDPSQYEYDPAVGLSSTILPPDPQPSLFALVNAGELEHLDIVLPSVGPNKNASIVWMKFVETNPDIIHGTANPEYTHYQPTGDQVFHMSLWFKPSARPVVQNLIKQLEALNDNE